jgi:V/A-type H+-transporting ATPase subunit E
MGSRELIESLRKGGDEKIRQMWKEAESEADAVRADAVRQTAVVREKHAKRLAAAADDARGSVLSGAEREARALRLQAEKKLSERLFTLARSQLKELRDHHYRNVFTMLAEEIPGLPWETIRVHPLDAETARGLFPESHIESDPAINGGLEAVSNSGKIRVINTFEKRLERAWEGIMPLLTRDVYRECVTHENS